MIFVTSNIASVSTIKISFCQSLMSLFFLLLLFILYLILRHHPTHPLHPLQKKKKKKKKKKSAVPKVDLIAKQNIFSFFFLFEICKFYSFLTPLHFLFQTQVISKRGYQVVSFFHLSNIMCTTTLSFPFILTVLSLSKHEYV